MTTNERMNELRLVPAGTARVPTRTSTGTPAFGDDYALVAGIRCGDSGAATALYRQYRPLVERTLVRILGFDSELSDAVQEAFIRALGSTRLLRDPQALPSWMIRIAVCTASDLIRRRKRRRWLHLFSDQQEGVDVVADFEVETDVGTRQALRAAQEILNGLPADERIALSLRRLDGMELKDVAHACGCSLATIKRRLSRAETRFLSRAEHQPALKSWLLEHKGAEP
jgi:RNA polymerase sigma-70 factor (ECF subfamily)